VRCTRSGRPKGTSTRRPSRPPTTASRPWSGGPMVWWAHGQTGPWPGRPMVWWAHGQTGPWPGRPMVWWAHGQTGPWPGASSPAWAGVHRAPLRTSWTDCFFSSLCTRHQAPVVFLAHPLTPLHLASCVAAACAGRLLSCML